MKKKTATVSQPEVPLSEKDLAELEQMVFSLSGRKSPAIAVAVCPSEKLRQRLLGELETRLPEYRHQIFDAAGKGVKSLYNWLSDQISADEKTLTLAHLLNLENNLWKLKGNNLVPGDMLPNLNMERESLFRDLNCIMVIWTNRHFVAELDKWAGDLSEWMNYRFAFGDGIPDALPDEPLPYREALPVPGITPERAARLKDQEERIDRLSALPSTERTDRELLSLHRLTGEEFMNQFSFKPARNHLEKALTIAKKLQDADAETHLLFLLGELCRNARDFESAISFFNAALAVNSRLVGWNRGAIFHLLGVVYLEKREFDVSIGFYQRAIEAYEQNGQSQSIGGTYHQLGRVYQEKQEFDTAIEFYNKAIEANQQSGQLQTIGSSLHQLGMVYEEKREFDVSIGFYQKAIETYEQNGQSQLIGGTYHQLGRVYQEKQEFDTAIEFYNKAIDAKQQSGQLQTIGSSLHQLGMVYEEKRELDTAIEFYNKAIDAKHQSGQLHEIGSTLYQLGMVYEEMGNLTQALDFYQQAKASAIEYGMTAVLEVIEESLARVEAKMQAPPQK